MYYTYAHSSSSPSLPGAWSSAWSLPQQYRDYEMGQKTLEVAEINCVGNDHDSLSSSNSLDLDRLEPTYTTPPSNHKSQSKSKADPPGALVLAPCLQKISNFQLDSPSTSIWSSSPQDTISDCNTFPGESSPSYSCPSFYSSHKSTPVAFESNLPLETLSLCQGSVSNSLTNSPASTSSRYSVSSSESGDINQESIHSFGSLRKPTAITRPISDNNNLPGNLDAFLHQPRNPNFLERIPRSPDTVRNYSSDFNPPSLLLSQPDGNNTWTLSLDPTISHPETISESSLGSESSSLRSSCPSDNDDEAITRIRGTVPSVYSTPRYDGSPVSLPPLLVGSHEFCAASDVSMIVSSTSSVPQRHGDGINSVPFSTANADSCDNDLSRDFPPPTVQGSALASQQPSRSKKLVKKSKSIFGRLKRLFTPKGTDIQGHTSHLPKSAPAALDSNAQTDMPPASGRRFLSVTPWASYQRYRRSTKASIPSLGQGFSPEDISHIDSHIDEKHTYEYHARPKTLKEIKSQRRFSLPLAFVGAPSRATSTKRNNTTSVPRSQLRPMSMYITSQSETPDSLGQLRNQQ